MVTVPRQPPRRRFEFEKLDAYQASLEFYDIARQIIRALPRDYLLEKDELKRAALSVMLNLCEGAGEFSRAEKARFYRMSLRSASECGCLIRLFEHDLGPRQLFDDAANLALRLMAMLTALATRSSK